jgi:fatty acid desaturase
MEDIFMEKIVCRKKDGIHYLKVTIVIITAFLLMTTLGWLMLAVAVLSFLLPIMVAGCVYGAWWLITSMDVEFEYIVTNGEIDIDRIRAPAEKQTTGLRTRQDFEIMGRLDGDEFREAAARSRWKNAPARSRSWTVRPSPGFRQLVLHRNNKSSRVMVVFDPDERI